MRDVRTGADACDQSAGYAEAALPHREHMEPATLESVEVGEHVVEASPDQPGKDRPKGDPADVVGIASPGRPAAAGDPDCGDDAQGDGEAIGTQLQPTDLDGVVARTGDGGEDRKHRRHGPMVYRAGRGARRSGRARGAKVGGMAPPSGWRPTHGSAETLPRWTS